jgi:DNA (cytosine-5)-methyltransferase 1
LRCFDLSPIFASMQPLKVIELFAGVGGFRLALEAVKNAEGGAAFQTIWNNQWEPNSKIQHASNIYVKCFGHEGHSNEDIERVIAVDFTSIPDHDVLVGGFPCQDYSVANTLSRSSGLVGKKGVLWWSIHAILERKKNPPKYLLLENVDRLLQSPAKQRGRDFAVMLASLSDLGYAVEWRVVNAADYGMPQRRRRTFIIGYHKTSELYTTISSLENPFDHILSDGPIATALPCEPVIKDWPKEYELKGSLSEITNTFNAANGPSQFENTGLIFDRRVFTLKTKPDYLGKRITLGQVLQPVSEVPTQFFLPENQLEKWRYAKGGKSIERTSKSGHKYNFKEGGMRFPDPQNAPSRTVVTSEGGTTPNRMTHVVEQEGRLRRLTPTELERLNMFPDGHTDGVSDTRRAFLMGNALVVGVIAKLGQALHEAITTVTEPA